MNIHLYHYTNFDNCLKIILSQTLLFNHLNKLNDINESFRPLYFKDFENDFESMNNKFQSILDSYQQLSLTIDDRRKGFDIPAMWGHYADKGNGVCLVLDTEKILSSLMDKVRFYDCVSYSDDYSPEIFTNYKSEKHSNIDEEMKNMFFIKTYDWSYEQEYRILAYAPNENKRLEQSIKGSLKAIIVHSFDDIEKTESVSASSKYKMLQKILPSEAQILEYSSFLGNRKLIDCNHKTIWSSN